MVSTYQIVTPHFPDEGVLIGSLISPNSEFPALIDPVATNGICFLYNSSENRSEVNVCLERIAWRIASSLPIGLCEFLVYNGGNPGENFGSLNQLPKSFFKSSQKVLFDADSEEFTRSLSGIYRDLAVRKNAIKDSGKNSIMEMNDNEVSDAKLKYTFVFLSDFLNATVEQVKLVSKLIAANCQQSGVFVFLSWDMKAKWTDDFDYQRMLDSMMLLFPKNDRYYFVNSGHDDLLNKFVLKLDGDDLDKVTIEGWTGVINARVNHTTKPAEVLKKDFAKVEAKPYEPVMSEISVSVGLDIEDKHEITVRFNSKDYIHAFILGQSGSGKSVLLNNIITTAILKYSPEDLMLYLLDFKGTEFNRYRGVKHAKAVLVDSSDPQITLEVLRELKEENTRRIKMFQKENVNDIDIYNRKHPDARLPQVLFVVDECQEMFRSTNNMRPQRIYIQNEISDILNTIATKGRSQGIHMLLATQQLDDTDISGQVLKNLTECFLLMSAPSDSDRLVPNSSDITSMQPKEGFACYYHKKQFQSRMQAYFAEDEELKSAIYQSQKKAAHFADNGSYYFCGSSVVSLDKEQLDSNKNIKCPVALIGKNVGLRDDCTRIVMHDDYFENVLFFGTNAEGKRQTTGVLISALASLIYSYQQMGKSCEILVIDCYQDENSLYKKVLQAWHDKGLCHIIERTKSGRTLAAIAEDIRNDSARPVVLAIIGSERFIEMKRNLPIAKHQEKKADMTENLPLDDNGGLEPLNFDCDLPDPFDSSQSSDKKLLKYQDVFTYILEEGAIQGVHVLLQVDKPGNILFEGDYGLNATDKFRHRVILKSENTYLGPMRFSQDIDVESLSAEEEHLRAFYYPEMGNPQLFTPFTLNESVADVF